MKSWQQYFSATPFFSFLTFFSSHFIHTHHHTHYWIVSFVMDGQYLIVKIIGFRLLVEAVLVDVIIKFFVVYLVWYVTWSDRAFVNATCRCIMLVGLMRLRVTWQSHLLTICLCSSPSQISTLLWCSHSLGYQYQLKPVSYPQSTFSNQVLVCWHAIFRDLTLCIFRWWMVGGSL